jgi:hypothetical protein
VAALILAMGAATAAGQVSLGGPDAPPAPDPAPAPAPAPRAPAPQPSTPRAPAAEEPSGPTPAELRAERRAEVAQQRREAQLRRQAELRRQRELALERKREAERRRLAAIERRKAAERRERQEAALVASRELEANRGNADALPSASSGDSGGGNWGLVAIALLVVAGITGTLSLFPAAARRYDMQGTPGVALLTRHRLELGTLCVGTLATLLLVQLLT